MPVDRVSQPFRAVIGLGNPGSEYAGTRHNMGFMLLERLLNRLPGSWEKVHQLESFCYYGRFRGGKLILQMPLTYMNNSGRAVAALLRRESVAPSEMLVVYDDMDLELGRLRLRRGGSAGGHHGVESIIAELNGESGFARLRLGIGHGADTIDHVLSRFTAEEAVIAEAVLEQAEKALLLALSRGLNAAMNECNGWSYAVPETAEAPAEKQES